MLSDQDSELLQEQAAGCRDAKERERLRALYALSVGYPIPKVAKIFCVDEGTVYRWIERWQEEKSLSNKPKKGRPATLTDKDKKMIRALLSEGNPKMHGIDADFWNTKELGEYFSKKGKKVSQETIRRCLRRMGARYRKASKASDADRKKWEEFLEVLVATMKYDPQSVLSIFDNEIPLPSGNSRGWTFKKKLVAKAPKKQEDIDDEFPEREVPPPEESKGRFIRLLKK
jgi:transposase